MLSKTLKDLPFMQACLDHAQSQLPKVAPGWQVSPAGGGSGSFKSGSTRRSTVVAATSHTTTNIGAGGTDTAADARAGTTSANGDVPYNGIQEPGDVPCNMQVISDVMQQIVLRTAEDCECVRCSSLSISQPPLATNIAEDTSVYGALPSLSANPP
jgi:hypothetical protein